jgi:hypothetical protein
LFSKERSLQDAAVVRDQRAKEWGEALRVFHYCNFNNDLMKLGVGISDAPPYKQFKLLDRVVCVVPALLCE